MTTSNGSNARAALSELQTDIARLRTACRSAFFDSDQATCGNVADAAQRFVDVTAPPLLRAIDAGDTSAAERFGRAASNIRNTVEQEAAVADVELSTGGLLTRFLNEVVIQTGVDATQGAKSVLPYVAAGGALAIGLWLLKR